MPAPKPAALEGLPERPRPRTLNQGRLLTQADVDASLGRIHRASRGRAYAQGSLVAVELTRYEDGRSLIARLLLPEALALRTSLDAAIADAEAAQAASDLRYRDNGHELEVAG